MLKYQAEKKLEMQIISFCIHFFVLNIEWFNLVAEKNLPQVIKILNILYQKMYL